MAHFVIKWYTMSKQSDGRRPCHEADLLAVGAGGLLDGRQVGRTQVGLLGGGRVRGNPSQPAHYGQTFTDEEVISPS